MNIQEFSHDKELLRQFLKEPPEWLQKIGSEQEQLEYLKTRVLIQILEKFEYKKPENFQGYKVFVMEGHAAEDDK